MAQSNEISKFLINKYKTISEKYELLKQIDRGAFGDVMLARDVISNEEKAIKVMRLMGNDDDGDENVDGEYIKKLKKEAELMSQLDHPNILKFDECFQYNIYFCIVSEYCQDNLTKVLQRHIGKKSRPSDESIKEWLYKLSKGLEYLHDKKVIHRDIKPSNILFKNNEIKIADFGESKDIMGTLTKTTVQHGTPHYMPPEVFDGERHTSKSDVWSLGCVFHEINYLELAFDGNDRYELQNNIKNKKIKNANNFKIDASKINDLIFRMIMVDQTERLSIKQVLKHEYFAGKKQDEEANQKKLIDDPKLIELCKNTKVDYQEIETMIEKKFVNVNYKNEKGETALIEASRHGHKNIVELLIKHKANLDDKDNDGKFALIIASLNHNDAIAELLIKNKANVNEKDNDGKTTLMIASSFGQQSIVELLIKNNANVNEKDNSGRTPLMSASYNYNKNVVELLIKNKANVNEKENIGMTALIWASMWGHKDVVELLIKNNANVNERDNLDSTALLSASVRGHKDIVELLIKNNANVNDKEKYGGNALTDASREGHKDVVELLIKNNANVDDKDSKGLTALMKASTRGHKDVVELLIKNNANINEKDNSGRTALTIASEYSHKNVVDLLRLYGAKS